MKKIAQENQILRQEKAALRKQKTKQILITLEQQGDERLHKLTLADEKRILRQIEEEKKLKLQNSMKRAKTAKRIQLAQEQAENALQEKKKKVAEKHEKDRIRHLERTKEEEKEMEMKILARIAKDEVRQERMESMHEEQIRRVVQFERKIKQGNKYIEIVREQKMNDLAVIKVKKELMMGDKLERIARDCRIKEYKRERTLRKMEVSEKRLKSTMLQKEQLIKDRKNAAIGKLAYIRD